MEETRKRWYFIHQTLANYVDFHLEKTCLKDSLQKKTDIGLPTVAPVKKKTSSKSLCFFSMVSIPLDFIPQIVAVDGAEALLGLRLYQTFIHFGTVEEWLLCLCLCRRVPATTSYKCKPKLDVCIFRWITYLVFYRSGFSPTTKTTQTPPNLGWSDHRDTKVTGITAEIFQGRHARDTWKGKTTIRAWAPHKEKWRKGLSYKSKVDTHPDSNRNRCRS